MTFNKERSHRLHSVRSVRSFGSVRSAVSAVTDDVFEFMNYKTHRSLVYKQNFVEKTGQTNNKKQCRLNVTYRNPKKLY